ncbi:MAG TPA: hypothetical protein VKM93_01975 [Terriglobia bacterium]|nr:hypothetical protein [Terriglobia bacterium]
MADLYEVSPPTIQSMPDPAQRHSLRLPEPRPKRTPKPEPSAEVEPEEVDALEADPKRDLDVTA